jgi:hypothetical protein
VAAIAAKAAGVMVMRIMPSNVRSALASGSPRDPSCRRASVLQRYLYVLITIAISPALRPACNADGWRGRRDGSLDVLPDCA